MQNLMLMYNYIHATGLGNYIITELEDSLISIRNRSHQQ